MLKSSARSAIRLRGVRHNNLKNFDLDLPLNQLIVVTGLSGSGKSSLAFDTLFAEGQRRYIETFSPYARQFFDRMDKPQVDSIEGIPPAIAIEQRNAVKTTRSTVGTMTEICDYMKMLWPHVAQLHCRQCGQPVRKDSPQRVWESINERGTRSAERGVESDASNEVLVTFDLPLSEKLSFQESLGLIAKQGYQRLLVGGQIIRLDELSAESAIRNLKSAITVVQDRVKLAATNRARFIEACEQAYHFGKGKLAIHSVAFENPQFFSNHLHCAPCDLEYREPSPALFSFNHPVGACPECKGFGRIISIDYNLALPDRSKTIATGVVKPWQTGHGLESQRDLLRMCRHFEIPVNVPFERLPQKWQDFVIEGDPKYGTDEEHEWPRAWYGVKGYFRWLESKAYKMHVRVLLSRYRAYTPCPACNGTRFQPDTLLYRFTIGDLRLTHRMAERSSIANCQSKITLADFYALPIRDALGLIDSLSDSRNTHHPSRTDPVALALSEVRSRLSYLNDVGLGYLTLERATRSLSGGETERVNLTTCLGTRLVNTLFVLDEPSVGLHPRDTERLVRILQQLRDAGNTVVVVEHEASVMRAANEIVDLGPGHGATGGQVVFQGSYPQILKSAASLTGQYLSGRRQIEIPQRRPVLLDSRVSQENSGSLQLNDAMASIGEQADLTPTLKIMNATRHNLQNISVEIPIGRFVCVTGVSGSGKTTLVREVLLPALETGLRSRDAEFAMRTVKASERIEDENEDDGEQIGTRNAEHGTRITGLEHLSRVVLVDQSILGKTPRSNPAVYIGAFDDIREFFAQSEIAKQRGLNASAFSFNSAQGQCERCRGAGFEKIEMQFLSDVFIRCPDCDGRRYREHILEVKVAAKGGVFSVQSSVLSKRTRNRKSATVRNGKALNTESLNTEYSLSIADVLDSTVEEAIEFLSAFKESRPAQRAANSLKWLAEVGLGYLKLGQPINTLSGGESQRLKLVRHLAEAQPEAFAKQPRTPFPSRENGDSVSEEPLTPSLSPSDGERVPERRVRGHSARSRTLFLLDEPTTGLHFDDVRVLLQVFQRLVDAGHSVLVIEHNLDVIKSADWIIDLGPGAGDEGGRIVAQGTPENVAGCEASHTGGFLSELLSNRGNESEKGGRGERGNARKRFASLSRAPARVSSKGER